MSAKGALEMYVDALEEIARLRARIAELEAVLKAAAGKCYCDCPACSYCYHDGQGKENENVHDQG